MRLFSSTTPRNLGERGRCASARSSHRVDANNPPSPLAQQLTKRKPASASAKKSTRRSKSAVYPIDLRELESELDHDARSEVQPELNSLLPDPRAYTATITVLHGLDLHNPCQIRSCSHSFSPFVELVVDDTTPIRFDAARHARNHSSWDKQSRHTHRVVRDTVARLHLLRVLVAAHCSRHPTEPMLVAIGQSDDIPLSLDPKGSTVSQFYPVFRYQIVQNRMIKYFAGKIKLTISITPDPDPKQAPDPPDEGSSVEETSYPRSVACDSAATLVLSEVTQVTSPPLLPANFGDALQLKRKQLKATVAPEIVNPALGKARDDPVLAQTLLEKLQARASHHVIRMCDVHVLEPIGEGVHANVFHAHVDGKPSDVAMKEFRYEAAATGALPPLAVLRAFEQECEMLVRVSSSESDSHAHSGRVVSFFGLMLAPRLAIFTDYCNDGSLARCLSNYDVWSRVPFRTKLVLGRDIASGLADLHNRNMVHRDIKTHNVMVQGLLGPNPIAKIGDLGSAIVSRSTDEMLHEETGSSGYTAPEVFLPRGYDHQADIWSLGIVLWELLCTTSTGSPRVPLQNPFLGACGDELVRKVERGDRPPIPPDSLPEWCGSLLQECWERDPARRPSAAVIGEEFTLHLSDYS